MVLTDAISTDWKTLRQRKWDELHSAVTNRICKLVDEETSVLVNYSRGRHQVEGQAQCSSSRRTLCL